MVDKLGRYVNPYLNVSPVDEFQLAMEALSVTPKPGQRVVIDTPSLGSDRREVERLNAKIADHRKALDNLWTQYYKDIDKLNLRIRELQTSLARQSKTIDDHVQLIDRVDKVNNGLKEANYKLDTALVQQTKANASLAAEKLNLHKEVIRQKDLANGYRRSAEDYSRAFRPAFPGLRYNLIKEGSFYQIYKFDGMSVEGTRHGIGWFSRMAAEARVKELNGES